MSENVKTWLFFALDWILVAVLCIPYMLGIKGFRSGSELFHLFPIGLMTLLPVGVAVLITKHVIRKIRQTTHEADEIVLGCSWITVGLGLFGIMLIIAVTGDV